MFYRIGGSVERQNCKNNDNIKALTILEVVVLMWCVAISIDMAQVGAMTQSSSITRCSLSSSSFPRVHSRSGGWRRKKRGVEWGG